MGLQCLSWWQHWLKKYPALGALLVCAALLCVSTTTHTMQWRKAFFCCMFQTLAWFLSMILREARQAVTWTAAARGVSEEHPALQRWPASCFAAHLTAFTYAKAAWKSSQSQGALHKRVSVFTATCRRAASGCAGCAARDGQALGVRVSSLQTGRPPVPAKGDRRIQALLCGWQNASQVRAARGSCSSVRLWFCVRKSRLYCKG